MLQNSFREKIFDFANKTYGVLPEYLWQKYPNFAVLRSPKNNKWFGIIMTLPRAKLGLEGEGLVDILNVKIKDAMLKDFLLHTNGFLKAYHMSKEKWISILLDGSVPLEQIFDLLEDSFNTVSKK